MRNLLAISILGLGVACGSSKATPDGGGGGGTIDAAGGGGGVVPDPGTAVGAEWTDIEPNDDPAHAVPVGILGSVWAGFADPITMVQTATDKDFFVFKTPGAADLASVGIQICATANLIDLHVYKVEGGMQGAEKATSAGTDTGCETAVASGEGPAKLEADTVYLLEVAAQPGGTGAPGMYSA